MSSQKNSDQIPVLRSDSLRLKHTKTYTCKVYCSFSVVVKLTLTVCSVGVKKGTAYRRSKVRNQSCAT
jgi:hypothetical protein